MLLNFLINWASNFAYYIGKTSYRNTISFIYLCLCLLIGLFYALFMIFFFCNISFLTIYSRYQYNRKTYFLDIFVKCSGCCIAFASLFANFSLVLLINDSQVTGFYTMGTLAVKGLSVKKYARKKKYFLEK